MIEKFGEWLYQSFPFLSEHPFISLICIAVVIAAGLCLVDIISKAIRNKNKKVNK